MAKKPSKINVGGMNHRVVVLRIIDRDEKGRPKTCVMGHDDTVFHLEGGEEFVTCYVPEIVLRKGN